jgi:hypothetical protein
MRIEVVMELRREAERRHYDKINSKHPIEDKYSGLGKAGHETRLRQMDANRAAANAHMDEVQARPVEGSLEHRRRVALTPGSEGFRLKG